jgi:hypothetical protein
MNNVENVEKLQVAKSWQGFAYSDEDESMFSIPDFLDDIGKLRSDLQQLDGFFTALESKQ